jgi:hypothetical protein
MSEAYELVNKAWKNTCRVLLGEEVGELKDYESYLKENVDQMLVGKSAVSGKPLFLSSTEYAKGCKFVSMEEVGQGQKAAAIDINSIKDIDSIVSALREQFYYCGNGILGNSNFVENSDSCVNVQYIYASRDLHDMKYAAYCSDTSLSEHIFGSQVIQGSFLIKCLRALKTTRCFEVFRTHYSSGCYFTGNLEGCTDCMFSFNLRNKVNVIGNLQLTKEEYQKRKSELISQMKEELREKRRLAGIIDIIVDVPKGAVKGAVKKKHVFSSQEKNALDKLETGFGRTSQVLFEKELSGMQEYGAWLERHVSSIPVAFSTISGEEVFVGGWGFLKRIKDNTCTLEESLALGKKSLSEKEAASLSLKNASRTLDSIKCVSGEAAIGNNIGIVMCNSSTDAEYCFRGTNCTYSRYCAYCLWPKQSQHLYGCSRAFDCSFCIHCYDSEKLTRCFEVSNSNSCADCYFCHNCENVQNGIFCFNVKNKRYAIGNVEVGRERYLEIKKKVLEQIGNELERTKGLRWDIYSIGCAKGK